jgi:hypothetical protein
MRKLMFALLVFLAVVGYIIYSLGNSLKFRIFKHRYLKIEKNKH